MRPCHCGWTKPMSHQLVIGGSSQLSCVSSSLNCAKWNSTHSKNRCQTLLNLKPATNMFIRFWQTQAHKNMNGIQGPFKIMRRRAVRSFSGILKAISLMASRRHLRMSFSGNLSGLRKIDYSGNLSWGNPPRVRNF